jgi:3-hydroxybutyryl-CoA dehydrogenase
VWLDWPEEAIKSVVRSDRAIGHGVRQGRAGVVVNALLVPYLPAAVRMAESGFATAADIGTGMELGCAYPLGPADLIGLDTVASIAESFFDEFREPLYAPSALLQRMVQAVGAAGPQEWPGIPRIRPGLSILARPG